jgi:macrolide-specific efflux system membrane fusion protein
MRLPRAVFVNTGLAVVLAGGAVWAYTSFSSAEAAESTTGNTRTVSVQQGTVTSTVTASGSVQSASTATATFGTSGTVTEIKVKVGDTVKKGAVLATVDDTAAQRNLEAAKADLDAAEDALDRAEEADSDTSDTEAQVTQAELAVDEAEDGVAGTVLKAPMAGTVTAVNGTVGSSAGSSGQSSSSSSSDGFVEIADLTKLEVSASVAEADATKLKAGQAATVTWNALPDATATAKVASIDPNATTENNVVTYGVLFSLQDVPDNVKAGQSVEVGVTVGQVENAVYVNSAALTSVGSRHTVTVMENGQQVTRTVEIGLQGDQATEITSGLTAGEQVVIRTTATTSNSSTGGGFPGGGGIPGGGGLSGGGGPGGGARTGGGR